MIINIIVQHYCILPPRKIDSLSLSTFRTFEDTVFKSCGKAFVENASANIVAVTSPTLFSPRVCHNDQFSAFSTDSLESLISVWVQPISKAFFFFFFFFWRSSEATLTLLSNHKKSARLFRWWINCLNIPFLGRMQQSARRNPQDPL